MIFLKKKKWIRRVGITFGILDTLEDSGLIFWNDKDRTLYVSTELAVLMMRSKKGWKNFLDNVFIWKSNRLIEDAWNSYFHKECAKDVMREKKKHDHLTNEDIVRINQQTRERLRYDDIKMPEIEEFSFAIVDAIGKWENKPEPVVVSVGKYGKDGELFMEEYDDVEEKLARLLEE